MNVTENVSSWVFHPMEAEPWRWRATVARERRAPWVWENALNLFTDVSQIAAIFFVIYIFGWRRRVGGHTHLLLALIDSTVTKTFNFS